MQTISSLTLRVKRSVVFAFLRGKQAASGFAEEAVKIFVVASIVGVMIWIGTVIYGMLQNSGSML
jgi:hypothetical protein